MTRRVTQHYRGQGAKYFRKTKPAQVIYMENNLIRATASQREYEIKQLSRQQKLQLIHTDENQISQYCNILEKTLNQLNAP